MADVKQTTTTAAPSPNVGARPALQAQRRLTSGGLHRPRRQGRAARHHRCGGDLGGLHPHRQGRLDRRRGRWWPSSSSSTASICAEACSRASTSPPASSSSRSSRSSSSSTRATSRFTNCRRRGHNSTKERRDRARSSARRRTASPTRRRTRCRCSSRATSSACSSTEPGGDSLVRQTNEQPQESRTSRPPDGLGRAQPQPGDPIRRTRSLALNVPVPKTSMTARCAPRTGRTPTSSPRASSTTSRQTRSPMPKAVMVYVDDGEGNFRAEDGDELLTRMAGVHRVGQLRQRLHERADPRPAAPSDHLDVRVRRPLDARRASLSACSSRSC